MIKILSKILIIIIILFGFSKISLSNKYVSASKCYNCHKEEYKIWEDSIHAKSFLKLREEQTKRFYCLQCHTTDGAKNFSGYKIQNVECEACHGMGEQHVKKMQSNEKSTGGFSGIEKITNMEDLCIRCHNTDEPTIMKFNYKDGWEKIAHGKNKKKS